MAKKLIKADTAPIRLKADSERWLEKFKQIPTGQALHLTEAEAGIKATTLRSMLWRLKREKQLSEGFRFGQHRDHKGILHIYIINQD